MKNMKKILALLVAVLMIVASMSVAFAKTVGTPAEGKGSIRINNASKGETYGVVKLFDATVSQTAASTTRAIFRRSWPITSRRIPSATSPRKLVWKTLLFSLLFRLGLRSRRPLLSLRATAPR